MDYQHDVFISYRSKSRDWLRKIFLPSFRHWLEEEIGPNVNIFVDYHDVETGDAWEYRLRNGLAHSKILISLLMPSYFESFWCKREFAVFERRSQEQGMLSQERPPGLIIPISLYKAADRFPPALRNMQIDFKYEHFYLPNIKGYKKTERYPELQEELRNLAQAVARKIRHDVPDWQPSWLEEEQLTPSTEHLEIINFTIQQSKI